jgi:hypothetical protein
MAPEKEEEKGRARQVPHLCDEGRTFREAILYLNNDLHLCHPCGKTMGGKALYKKAKDLYTADHNYYYRYY